jgi:phenylacetate-CoA ligase
MSDYFDALETRDAGRARSGADGGAAAADRARAGAQRGDGRDPGGRRCRCVTSRAALAQLPVTRKSELLARQQASRAAGRDAFGGFSAMVLRRRHAAPVRQPGPIYEPEGTGRDYWRAARAMYAAGFRAGDLAHNAFSYHMTPGAFIMESGAHAVGCTVFPAGTGQTEQQLQAIAELQAAGLHRHAQLPAHPGGKSAGDGQRHHQPEKGPGRRRGLSAEPARLVHERGWPSTRATPPPTSAW